MLVLVHYFKPIPLLVLHQYFYSYLIINQSIVSIERNPTPPFSINELEQPVHRPLAVVLQTKAVFIIFVDDSIVGGSYHIRNGDVHCLHYLISWNEYSRVQRRNMSYPQLQVVLCEDLDDVVLVVEESSISYRDSLE